MTSKSLFFKLLRENVKRRAWAIALAVLGFFFSLPINLALTMENAIKTKFWRYNDYEQLIFAEGISEAEKLAKILEIKTQIVLDSVKFGNGLIAFLMIVAAVVIGVSSFSYLHNRRKVDFYHSIPVRREILFAVQYVGGFLIVALAGCELRLPGSAVLCSGNGHGGMAFEPAVLPAHVRGGIHRHDHDREHAGGYPGNRRVFLLHARHDHPFGGLLQYVL